MRIAGFAFLKSRQAMPVASERTPLLDHEAPSETPSEPRASPRPNGHLDDETRDADATPSLEPRDEVEQSPKQFTVIAILLLGEP